MIGKKRAVAMAARMSSATPSAPISSPLRCRSSRSSSSDSSMIDSIRGPRRSSIIASSSARAAADVGSPPVKSSTLRPSRFTKPVRRPSTSSGTSSGWASPKVRLAAGDGLGEVGASLLQLGHGNGPRLGIASHSRHNSRVASSISSLAGTTKRTASAARSPARTSPTKSGIARRVHQVHQTRSVGDRRGREGCDGVGSPRARRPGVRAATRRSKRADFPAPAGPTSTTLRICSGDSGSRVSASSLAMTLPCRPRRPEHKRAFEGVRGDCAPRRGGGVRIRPGTAGYASDPVNGREGQTCQNEIRWCARFMISASPPGSADR